MFNFAVSDIARFVYDELVRHRHLNHRFRQEADVVLPAAIDGFMALLLSVTAVFFFLNLTLTLGTLWLGLEYRGYGYLLATLISLVFGYSAAASRILRLPYMTFIANNRGL